MTFEENLKKLDKSIERLENNATTLDEGIKEFEAGIGYTRECLDILNKSKGKITVLKKELSKLTEEPYEL